MFVAGDGPVGVLVLAGSSGRVEEERCRVLAGLGATAASYRWFGETIDRVPLESFEEPLATLHARCRAAGRAGDVQGRRGRAAARVAAPRDRRGRRRLGAARRLGGGLAGAAAAVVVDPRGRADLVRAVRRRLGAGHRPGRVRGHVRAEPRDVRRPGAGRPDPRRTDRRRGAAGGGRRRPAVAVLRLRRARSSTGAAPPASTPSWSATRGPGTGWCCRARRRPRPHTWCTAARPRRTRRWVLWCGRTWRSCFEPRRGPGTPRAGRTSAGARSRR